MLVVNTRITSLKLLARVIDNLESMSGSMSEILKETSTLNLQPNIQISFKRLIGRFFPLDAI
ncbi:hypothetical protein Lalb_Chr19g0128321 [Lupinus albus]|uniref:Uncharacterized protein n=1 Tax=Lupinus albus TaxID=3870 RepID=A0A6A4NJV9_LUPAL|nr:hypothetical protein Lalb_Chr19g0128321 [Lupinus albus]